MRAMKKWTFAVRIGGCLALGLGLARAAPPLAVGERAPDFALRGSDGAEHRLKDLIGRRGVVLAFFPRAFTPGCTRELESLRDSERALAQFDVSAFMVSLDTPERNREFARSLGASLVLLSATPEVARAYDVLDPSGKFTLRRTFFIDPHGLIRHIDTEVNVAEYGRAVADRLAGLGFPRRAP
jgi:peroxiredoxin Q/BCP